MVRKIICFLLISLNVVCAFDNHEGDFLDTLEAPTQISYEFNAADADDPRRDHNQPPTDEHTCHLGHCSFYLSDFQFVANIIVTRPFFSNDTGVLPPFIDQEIRPPIFS